MAAWYEVSKAHSQLKCPYLTCIILKILFFIFIFATFLAPGSGSGSRDPIESGSNPDPDPDPKHWSKVNFASYSTGYGTLHTFLVITTLGVLQLDGILFLFMEISVTGVAPDKTTFFSRIKNVKKLELEPKLGKQ